MTDTAVARARLHVTRFNHAVTTGDWEGFVEWFTPDATMELGGVDVPALEGREALLDAYDADPPTDSMHAAEAGEKDGVDVVRFAWSRGGTGTMWITWDGDLVSALVITNDPG